jgi:transcriptional regulator with XRE-family HTH domain
LPFCHISLKAEKPRNPAYPESLKSLGDHLRKKRLDLKLFQRDVAQIVGADTTTVFYWESNRVTPSLKYLPKIIDFLGYVPLDILPEKPGEKIAFYRRLLGLGQRELGRLLGIDPSTLWKWENGKSQPSPKLFEKLEGFFKGSLAEIEGEKIK